MDSQDREALQLEELAAVVYGILDRRDDLTEYFDRKDNEDMLGPAEWGGQD